ncbi:heparinase II/III domain-containing protein [Halocatena marina]|uniref:heparinase II/III domain-containing protein n=1 Tax=Halocatena marina TaxID=2934937 RepID=UPI00200DE636|nr:heparinase II/III family protein [Halocatena marina]
MVDTAEKCRIRANGTDSRNLGCVADSSPVNRRNFMKASSITTLGLLASSENATAKTASGSGKSRPTYYTSSERQAARKNIQKYDWAKTVRDDVVAAADTILSYFTLDDLWRYVGSQNIPRSAWLARQTASHPPESSEWEAKFPVDGIEPATEPGKQWKITNGKYTLPTNDFEAYRQSGLDDKGTFDPELADESHLVNEEHPEKGKKWGVDDGLGWVDTNGDIGTAGQRWVPVAWTHHWMVVYGYRSLVGTLSEAYLYTRKQKYARAASVILDRVADVYPEFSLQNTVYFDDGGYTAQNGFPNPGHGGTGRGKQIGSIWESYWIKELLIAYDAVFPAQTGDKKLTSFLDGKTTEFSGLTPKTSVTEIRSNIETGLVQEVLPAIKRAQIRGNFGSHQTTLAVSAVVQDDPNGYTGDAIDFLFKEGGLKHTGDDSSWGAWRVTGGDVLPSLLGMFDRDGFPFEGSIHYNSLVKSAVQSVGQVLNEYESYSGTDLTENAFFKQMIDQQESLVFLNKYVPSLGDTKHAGNPGFDEMMPIDNLVQAHTIYGGTELAKWIHLRNSNTTQGLRGGIFDREPNAVTDAVTRSIDAAGPLELDSRQLAGFGFTALRAGTTESSKRAIWTYYGRNGYGPDVGYGTSHCHRDTLNIGVFAHGLDLSPDLGYPEKTGDWPKRWNWTANTISHNTVLVNKHEQEKQWVSTPKHFDHTDRVQLFDVDASNVYEEVDQYRRTTAQITVDENDSYAVDFFRVDGGHDHHFSFHGAQTETNRSTQKAKQNYESLVLHDGGGRVSSRRSRTTEHSAIELINTSPNTRDWRGVAVRSDGETTASVTIDAALLGARWPINQSVYLGQDMGGRHVCAGIGLSRDANLRLGLFYPETEVWDDYEEINWERIGLFNTSTTESSGDSVSVTSGMRGRDIAPPEIERYRGQTHVGTDSYDSSYACTVDGKLELTVSVAGIGVDVGLTANGSTLGRGSFSLDSTTDDRMGVFGATDNNQIGRLLFEDFKLDGTPVAFFETNEGWKGMKSQTGVTTHGLTLTAQQRGTYAGVDVPKPGHGKNTDYNESVGNGFNYLYNVRCDDDPSPPFSVDWSVADHWNVRSEKTRPHLRLTMVADADTVALAEGDPPQRGDNPDAFTYLIAHRSGNALRTVFTSVIEPYEKSRFIESISAVPVESDDPTARAVKVELTSGRIDYVASASDHSTTHSVGNVFSFKGVFAVYTEDDQQTPTYAYLNDGVCLESQRCNAPLIDDPSGRIEGTVTDFTCDLCLDNTIEIKITEGLSGQCSLSDVIGAWIYADAVENRNGAYEIKDAKWVSNNCALLTVGQTTTVKDFSEGNTKYEYILKRGGNFTIPLSKSWKA